jgi:hypothetical protein
MIILQEPQETFFSKTTGVMPWPALSPDLNPIEHILDDIQR